MLDPLPCSFFPPRFGSFALAPLMNAAIKLDLLRGRLSLYICRVDGTLVKIGASKVAFHFLLNVRILKHFTDSLKRKAGAS